MVAGAASRGAGPVTGTAGRVGGYRLPSCSTTRCDAIWRAVAIVAAGVVFDNKTKSRAY